MVASVFEREQRNEVCVSVLGRGAVLFGVGLAMITVGVWRVDVALATLGLGLCAVVGFCRLLARGNVSRLAVALELPERVEEGGEFVMRMVLENGRRWQDGFGLDLVVDLAGRFPVSGRIPWIGARACAVFSPRVAIPQRMIADTHRVRVVSRSPLGLFGAETVYELSARVVVLPRSLRPRGLKFASGPLELSDDDRTAGGAGPGELRGLREWSGGDSPKRIQWPATTRSMARGAGWLVLETDPPAQRPERFVVVVHSCGAGGALIRPERFERAIRLAAGTLRTLRAHGVPARLLADFDDWRSRPVGRGAQWADCMEILAGARRAAGTETHELQAALAKIPPGEGIVIVSDMPRATWENPLPAGAAGAILPDSEPIRRRGKEVSA